MNESGVLVGHFPCPDCGSKDNLAVYEQSDGVFDGFCYTPDCGYKNKSFITQCDFAKDLGVKDVSKKEGKKLKMRRKKKQPISEEVIKEIVDKTSYKGRGYRGIKYYYNKLYKVRTEFDEETGEPLYRYYPCTKGVEGGKPKLVGYKVRDVNNKKNFRSVGIVSKECELFGQWACKGNKYLLITGGEEDCIAAKQMLHEAKQENWAEVDVVASSISESAVDEQCRINYDFIDRYDTIVVNMDMDDEGRKAEKKLLDVLPAGKVKVMQISEKDACDMLKEGKEDEYVFAFYSAQKPKIHGVISGKEMWDEMIRSVSMPLIPLPPMLRPLEEKLCGGLPYGEIISILAASGIGKTTITNNLIKYWIFNSPYKIGILSMEAGAGKFLTRLVSCYLGKNVARMTSNEEKVRFLEEHKEECFELFFDENGNERFYLVDDKGELDSLDAIKRTIERMVKQGGVELVIIDPVQDALDALTVEEQAAFVGWQKKMKGRHGTTFININHTRKSGGGKVAGSKGGELTEEDMQGSSALYKSSAVNIILTRDKTHEDPEVRNTTKITLFKARDTGDTGPAGELYYEVETATLYNKEDWVKNNAGF